MNHELEFDNELLDSSKSEVDGKRPVFLTVLCILTFVGSGLGLIYALFMLITLSMAENLWSGMNQVGDFDQILGNYYRWMKITVVLVIAGCLLCIIGSILMMTLRKLGYYLYIIGELLPFFGFFMLMNSIPGTRMDGPSLVFTIILLIFPLAFIIMYGLNLKHMRK